MNKTRRNLMLALGAGVVAIPLSSVSGIASAADVPKLNPKTAPATALGYTHKSSNAKKVCSGCQFYSDAAAEWGPCLIFPGTHVAAKGTCNSWVKRAT